MVRADFGSGLIRPRAQTCCASPTQTPARLANSPGFKSFRYPRERIKFSLERFSNHSAAHCSESNSRSNVFQIRRESVCVPSRWKVLSGEFRRRPTALAIKFQKPARVGRRGLSEPREDFSRLLTDAFPWLDSVARFRGSIPWLDSVARFRGSIPWLDSVARFRGSIPWLDSAARFRGKFNPTLVADSVDSRLLARLLEPLHFHFHLQQFAAQFLQLDHR